MPKTSTSELFRIAADSLRDSARKRDIRRYEPFGKQEKFHSNNSKGRQFIGGNRSGKSVSGVIEAIWYSTDTHPYKSLPWKPPLRGRVVGVDFVQGIEKIIQPIYKDWLPKHYLIDGSWEKSYNKELRTFTLANRSTIEFMSYDQEVAKFAGTSRHWTHFDEEPPKAIFTECQARLVDTAGHWWMSMTPVDGMTWTYDEIFENDNIYTVIVDITENPYLDPTAIDEFLRNLSPEDRKARKEGKYVSLGGLIYPEFQDRHIIAPFKPPVDSLWIAAMDHGFTNPTAWIWSAIDREGRIFLFDEYYVINSVIHEHARNIHEINRKHGRPPDYNVGDPSIRNRDPITGTSIHAEYATCGLPIALGNHDVRAGIDLVKKYLQQDKLFVVETNYNTIREWKKYRWAVWKDRRAIYEKNLKEEPQKKDDHIMDAIRYLVASRPDPKQPPPPRKPVNFAEAAPALDIAGKFVDTDYREKSEAHADYHLGEDF